MENNQGPDRQSDDRPMSDYGGGGTNFRAYFNHAMRSATIVGVGFLVQGVALLMYRFGLISTLLYFVGLVLVPVLIATTGKKYFDTQVVGPIHYLSAAAYLFWTFILSLIICTLVYYGAFYFLFRDPVFGEMMSKNMEIMREVVRDKALLEEMEESYAMMTPKTMTMSVSSFFFFVGTVYVYILAIFFRRS